jgi:hypothetical protein
VKAYLDALAERTGVLDSKRGKFVKAVGMAAVGMGAAAGATGRRHDRRASDRKTGRIRHRDGDRAVGWLRA